MVNLSVYNVRLSPRVLMIVRTRFVLRTFITGFSRSRLWKTRKAVGPDVKWQGELYIPNLALAVRLYLLSPLFTPLSYPTDQLFVSHL